MQQKEKDQYGSTDITVKMSPMWRDAIFQAPLKLMFICIEHSHYDNTRKTTQAAQVVVFESFQVTKISKQK